MQEEVLDEILRGIDTIQGELMSMKETMATKEELAIVKETMATKEELASMEERMIGRFATMATKADVADIPTLKVAILEVSDTVNAISDQMATKEDLQYYDKKIMEHDRDIYKIKQRVV